MRYRTVLFDADNTLLDFTRSEHDALCDCLTARGLPHDEEAIARYSAINDGYWKRLERGEVTRAALQVGRFADFIAEYGFSCDAATLAKEYMLALSTKSFLVEGAESLCRSLVPSCRLYLITNGTDWIQHGRFDPCPLAPLFSGVFISDSMGCEKPERAYFDMVTAAIPDFDPGRYRCRAGHLLVQSARQGRPARYCAPLRMPDTGRGRAGHPGSMTARQTPCSLPYCP